MMNNINTKTKMYRYLSSGLFGNTCKIYKNIEEIPDNTILSMRWKQIANMKNCNPNMTKKNS